MEKCLLVQGDVFLVKIEDLPDGCKRIAKRPRGYVLAEGEVTGHAHCITEDIELYEKDNILYLKTDNSVNITHEEHKPVIVNKGIWQVGIVKEYDPFMEESRNVKD